MLQMNGLVSAKESKSFERPVSDMVTFLAELYSQGYQYRSLNSYRSAISSRSIHSNVEGHPVGELSLVSRVLKGKYNSRPPIPRYNTFWDVGVVLKHIRGRGQNSSSSLHQLSLKTAMLLALTKPSRSVDLAYLDIGTHSAKNKDQKLVGHFLRIGYFIGYYTAVPLKMYGKFGRSK